jgi:uncharacterized protein YukE
MHGFTVDPSSLLQVAERLEQASIRVQSELDILRGAGVSAEAAAGNHLASGGIGGFVSSWEAALCELSAALSHDARTLRLCASLYQRSDTEVAANLQLLGQ